MFQYKHKIILFPSNIKNNISKIINVDNKAFKNGLERVPDNEDSILLEPLSKDLRTSNGIVYHINKIKNNILNILF